MFDLPALEELTFGFIDVNYAIKPFLVPNLQSLVFKISIPLSAPGTSRTLARFLTGWLDHPPLFRLSVCHPFCISNSSRGAGFYETPASTDVTPASRVFQWIAIPWTPRERCKTIAFACWRACTHHYEQVHNYGLLFRLNHKPSPVYASELTSDLT